MSTCAACKREFDKDVIVPCCSCSSLFHANYNKRNKLNCAKINEAEDQIIKQQQTHVLVYQCEECKSKGGINPALEKLITLLNTRIDNLEVAAEKISGAGDNSEKIKNIEEVIIPEKMKENLYETVHEANEIIRKSNNIIIHGVKDSDSKDEDKIELEKIFKAVGLKYNNNFFKRLGVYGGEEENNAARPLLVKMDTVDDVYHAIMNKNKTAEGINIVKDKTELQRKLLKEALQELENKKSAVYNNYHVKYIKDIPKVVVKNKNMSKNQKLQQKKKNA